MGKPYAGADDPARTVEPGRSVADPYLLNASSQAATPWVAFQKGDFNIALWGGVTSGLKTAFTGTVALERSFDGGTTADQVTYVDGTPVTWSSMQHSGTWFQIEIGMLWRLRATSGSGIYWRMSQ